MILQGSSTVLIPDCYGGKLCHGYSWREQSFFSSIKCRRDTTMPIMLFLKQAMVFFALS